MHNLDNGNDLTRYAFTHASEKSFIVFVVKENEPLFAWKQSWTCLTELEGFLPFLILNTNELTPEKQKPVAELEIIVWMKKSGFQTFFALSLGQFQNAQMHSTGARTKKLLRTSSCYVSSLSLGKLRNEISRYATFVSFSKVRIVSAHFCQKYILKLIQ